MLYWTLVFLLGVVLAGIFGLSGITGPALGISKILFFVFSTLFVISLVFGLKGRRSIVSPRH